MISLIRLKLFRIIETYHTPNLKSQGQAIWAVGQLSENGATPPPRIPTLFIELAFGQLKYQYFKIGSLKDFHCYIL